MTHFVSHIATDMSRRGQPGAQTRADPPITAARSRSDKLSVNIYLQIIPRKYHDPRDFRFYTRVSAFQCAAYLENLLSPDLQMSFQHKRQMMQPLCASSSWLARVIVCSLLPSLGFIKRQFTWGSELNGQSSDYTDLLWIQHQTCHQIPR